MADFRINGLVSNFALQQSSGFKYSGVTIIWLQTQTFTPRRRVLTNAANLTQPEVLKRRSHTVVSASVRHIGGSIFHVLRRLPHGNRFVGNTQQRDIVL